MVPNQRQLFIVLSDWGSDLVSHFLIVLCGILTVFSYLVALLASRFVCVLLFCLVSFDVLKYGELYARCALVQSFDRDNLPL